MSAPRLPTDVGRLGGGRLMRHLRTALDALPNVAYVDEAPVVDLGVEDGAVTGRVIAKNGARQRVRARTVVLATDGFAASPALMDRSCAELGAPFYGGVSTSNGDTVGWLEGSARPSATWVSACAAGWLSSATAPGSHPRCSSTAPSWSTPTASGSSTRRRTGTRRWPDPARAAR